MSKRKIVVATASLLLCLTVLISASYAWISLSRAPEINGIATNIGSNGSLEVALLSTETFMDPSLIKSAAGDSAVIQGNAASNLSWGNVIDLSDASYGFDKISLLPSRLNVVSGEEGVNSVGSNILGFVDYNADGRIESNNMETVSAVFSGEDFIFNVSEPGYGVRGIGTISNVSPQQAALTASRSLVSNYRNTAVSEAKAVWSENGKELIDIFRKRYALGETVFTAEEVKTVIDTAKHVKSSLDHIDLALRHGIIGYGASMIDDENTFKTLRSTVENTSIPLSFVISSVSGNLPSGITGWIEDLDVKRYQLQEMIKVADKLPAGIGCSWDQLEPVITFIIDPERTFLGNSRLSESEAFDYLAADNTLGFSPNSGIFSDIAEFCGNYKVLFTYSEDSVIEAASLSTISTPRLIQISEKLDECEAAGEKNEISSAPLLDIYGYAVDLAFRCNQESDLLLQTEAAARYGEETESGENMGTGSHMSFSSDQLSEEQMLMLVDAIRIGFIDNKNNLAAVAKLGTTGYVFEAGTLSAPLWLYEYELSEGGSIIMGERRTGDSRITNLIDDVPITLSVVVWLDGDNIFNSQAAISGASISGILNLQFASSAELNPADISVNPFDN